MKNGSITVTTSLLIKTLILSFIFLTVAFTAGLIIGKTDLSVNHGTGAGKGKIGEQLSACSFKLQEMTTKHLSLVELAKSKGIMTPEGKIDNNVICTYVKKIEKEEDEDEKPASKTVEKKETEKKCHFSIQLFSDTNKQLAISAKKRYNLDDTHLVEGEIDGKSWYRLRHGCFSNRADAEKKLPEIREIAVDALVVAN